MEKDFEHTIVVVGAGFAGVRAAQNLSKKRLPKTRVILLSNKHHFEYYPALYKVVTGRSPLEVCIPLSEIFPNNRVEVIIDEAESFDIGGKKVIGKSGSAYQYEYLILALGSETVYFDIPGLKENSFGFKSINEALRLKNHLHSLFDKHAGLSPSELEENFHIAVVGGGASGVELSAELARYAKELAKRHEMDSVPMKITLIEAAPQLVPMLPEKVSAKISARLKKLGIVVMANEAVTEENHDALFMKDGQKKDGTMPTKTVIWTSGVKPNHLYGTIAGIEMEKNGRVVVKETLEARGVPNVFILGDAADTKYSGMAQTALYDGAFVADAIARRISGKKIISYHPHKAAYSIPVGRGWALFMTGPLAFYGCIPYLIRQFIDLSFFFSILPCMAAIRAFKNGTRVSESCPTCLETMKKYYL